jgi:hypothetical protein
LAGVWRDLEIADARKTNPKNKAARVGCGTGNVNPAFMANLRRN